MKKQYFFVLISLLLNACSNYGQVNRTYQTNPIGIADIPTYGAYFSVADFAEPQKISCFIIGFEGCRACKKLCIRLSDSLIANERVDFYYVNLTKEKNGTIHLFSELRDNFPDITNEWLAPDSVVEFPIVVIVGESHNVLHRFHSGTLPDEVQIVFKETVRLLRNYQDEATDLPVTTIEDNLPISPNEGIAIIPIKEVSAKELKEKNAEKRYQGITMQQDSIFLYYLYTFKPDTMLYTLLDNKGYLINKFLNVNKIKDATKDIKKGTEYYIPCLFGEGDLENDKTYFVTSPKDLTAVSKSYPDLVLKEISKKNKK